MAKERRQASVEWTRLLGIVLVLLAISLASDPDYPMQRPAQADEVTVDTRPPGTSRLEALRPSGPVAAGDLEFSWGWTGPDVEWRLCILDAGLEVVWESPATTATALRPPPDVRDALPPGTCYWRVVAVVLGRRVRCSPVMFSIAEPAAGPR